jgi:nitroreductase
LAVENMLLAAEFLSIGSCVIASSAFMFMSKEAGRLKKELGLPDGYVHVCTVALGYKDGETPATPPRNKDVINFVK